MSSLYAFYFTDTVVYALCLFIGCRLLYQQQQDGPEYSQDPAHHRAGPTKRHKKKNADPNSKSIRRSNSGNGVPNQLPSLHRQAEISPRMDPKQAGNFYHMDQAEKRLEELQKLASTTATIKSFVQQQQQQLGNSGPYLGPNSAGQAVGLGLPASRLPLGSAAAAAVAQMARPGTFMDSAPHTASASRHAMTGSEADFLVRQINSATDVSQLSMFSNMDEYETVAAGLDGGGSMTAGMGGLVAGGESIWSTDGFPAPSQGLNQSSYQSQVGANANVGSVAGVMNDALKEKMTQLERQVNSLNGALARKEAELDKKDVKIKKLNSEVETLRRDNANELRRLTAEVPFCTYFSARTIYLFVLLIVVTV